MKLIPEWRKCWRMFSQQAFVAAGSLQTTWLVLDKDQRDSLPGELITWFTLTIIVLGFIGRLVPQKKVSGGGDEN